MPCPASRAVRGWPGFVGVPALAAPRYPVLRAPGWDSAANVATARSKSCSRWPTRAPGFPDVLRRGALPRRGPLGWLRTVIPTGGWSGWLPTIAEVPLAREGEVGEGVVAPAVVQVVVADDSEVVRRGLTEIIDASGDLHVVGQAWDGGSAVETVRRLAPRVVLMDIRMPGMDGITATRQILALPDPPRVLILTMFSEDQFVDDAVCAGAAGFLLKDTPPRELMRAIREVAAGRSMLDPIVTARVMEQAAAAQGGTDDDSGLTEAERRLLGLLGERDVELVRLIAQGMTNADIGARLHVAEGTVRSQVSRLLTRLGFDNRVQIARLAYRAGLGD